MQRMLLAVLGVLMIAGVLLRQHRAERDRKARWREIEHNAELMRGIQTNQGASFEGVMTPPVDPEAERAQRERIQQQERDRELERLRKMI